MTTSVVYDFTGAVVLVTGGGSGIGAATARAVAAAGGTAIAVDVDAARLADVATSRVIPKQVDVADPEAVRMLVAEVVRDHGRIDAAVLAAAIQRRTPVDAITDAEWRRHVAVNLDGVFHCIREVAPVMKRQRKGALLTFTSGLVNMGWPGASAYAASKGALIGLTKCAAQELRAFGVRANVLSPGLVATPVFLDVATADEVAMYRASVGISAPEAVVPTVLHLISDASASLTGAVIELRLVPAGSAALYAEE